jgi:hypothetical protein
MPTYLDASVNRATVNETWEGTFTGTYWGRKNSFAVQQGFSIPAWRWQMPFVGPWGNITTTEPPGAYVTVRYESGSSPSALFPYDFIPSPNTSSLYIIMECENGYGARDVAYVERTFSGSGVVQSLAISGEWSFSAQCEEVLHPYFMDEAVRGADGSPTYGGAASDDIVPRAQGQHFYLRFREGGTAVASGSLTVDGTTVTATASSVVSASGPGSALYGYYPTCRMDQFSVNKSGSMSATFTNFGDEAVDADTDTHTDAYSQEVTRSLSVGGSDVTLSQGWTIYEGVTIGSPGNMGDGRGESASVVFLTMEPQDTLGLACKFFAMDANYPSPGLDLSYLRRKSLSAQTLTCNPFNSAQWTRRSYGSDGAWGLNYYPPAESDYGLPGDGLGDGGALTLGDFDAVSADEKEPLRSWVNSASLAARGEEPQDWRTLFRGYRYNLGTLTKDATIGVGGGTGASRSWSPNPGNWEGYRFLRVRLKVTSGGSVEFTASATATPSKTFKTTATMTADTFQYVWFDLCNPDGGTWTTDNLDTRYPVLGDGLPEEDPDSRGVGRITALTISGGTGLTVDTIDLAHWQDIAGGLTTDPPTLTCAPVWNWWTRTQETGDVVEAYVGLQGDANGRRSCDVPIASRQLFTDAFGAAFWVYSQVTINAARIDLLNTPGWNWADGFSPVTGDTWHRTGLSGSAAYGSQACWIGGGGVTISGNATGDFLNWMGRDLTGGLSMVAQSLMDEVRLWPRCGEVFQKGSTGGRTWLRTAKVLRGGAMGAVFGGADPASDVTLYESPGTDPVATDAVDECRHYAVGSPYARMNESLTPDPRTYMVRWNSAQHSTHASKARRWWRVHFQATEEETGKNISSDMRQDGTRYRAYISSLGKVVTGKATRNSLYSDTTTAIDGDWANIQAEKYASAVTLFLLVQPPAGGVVEYKSTDGSTWTMSRTIVSSGKYPAAVCEADGVRYSYWLNGTQVDGEITDRSGAILASPTACVTGVDDSGIAVLAYAKSEGRVVIELQVRKTGAIVVYTSSDGRTFV